MRYLIVLGLLLFSCKANVEKCEEYVEKSFGKVEFIYQNTSDYDYDVLWYSVEEDTLIITNHGGTGWDIVSFRYLDDNKLVELCSNNVAVIRRYHRVRNQYKKTKGEGNKGKE